MKRITIIFTTVMLLFLFTSCNHNNSPTINDVTPTILNSTLTENPEEILHTKFEYEYLESIIYDFLVENYITVFYDWDTRMQIYNDFYDNKLIDTPKGFETKHEMMATGFDIYELVSGELLLVITMNKPETNAFVYRFYRYIDDKLMKTTGINSSFTFYENDDCEVVLLEGSDMDGFYRFSYLTIVDNSFQRDVFAEFGKENRSEYVEFDLEGAWSVCEEIELNYSKVTSISTDSIVEKFADEYIESGLLDKWMKENMTIPDSSEAVILKDEDTLLNRANLVLHYLKYKDLEQLAALVHPTKGVTFTPYGYVSDTDMNFSASDVKNLTDNKLYHWGKFDYSGEPMNLSFSDYYEDFIYPVDFINAKTIGNNTVIQKSFYINNIAEVYPNGKFIEYNFPSSENELEFIGEQSLRIVFEEMDSEWYIVAIVYDCWNM